MDKTTETTTFMQISDQEMKFLLQSQQGELDAVPMYQALAAKVKDPKDAETFRKLAAEEGHHAAVLKQLTNTVLKPKKAKSIILPLLYKFLGKKRLYAIISQGEYKAAERYAPMVARFPTLESVMNDEKRHGDMVKDLL